MTQSWQFFALASAFFAGLTAIFGKVGVADVPSNLATLIRTVIIFFVALGFVVFRSEWPKPGSLSNHGLTFLVLSGLATGLSWLCYYHALSMAPASKVAPIDKLSVIFTLVLAFLFLGETPTLPVVLGGMLITAGALVIVLG